MTEKFNWDKAGIMASFACAVHCAVLPLVLTSLPIFGTDVLNNDVFEYSMIALAFAVGIFGLYHGYRKHHQRIFPFLLFGAGFAFLLSKQVWHQYHNWLLVPAVAGIISAHFLNLRLSRRSGHPVSVGTAG
jgi:hypothetical protein